MTKWFRFYADALRNPKVAGLSDRDFRLWVSLLAAASENDGCLPEAQALRHMLSVRLDHLLAGIDRLISAGLIDRLASGYAPHNWGKFQYKSDTSTGRVQQHRRGRNVSETPPDTEQRQKQKIEPIAQQPTAARRDDLVDLLCQAAGVRGNPPTGLAFPGEIHGLTQAGYELETDILPAIRSRPNPSVRSWSYYVPVVREFVAKRQAAASVPKPQPPQVNWNARMEVWHRDGTWGDWGPKPGESGCQAPAELLRAA